MKKFVWRPWFIWLWKSETLTKLLKDEIWSSWECKIDQPTFSFFEKNSKYTIFLQNYENHKYSEIYRIVEALFVNQIWFSVKSKDCYYDPTWILLSSKDYRIESYEDIREIYENSLHYWHRDNEFYRKLYWWFYENIANNLEKNKELLFNHLKNFVSLFSN